MKNMLDKIVVFVCFAGLFLGTACSAPDDSRYEGTRYVITVKAAANGRVSANRDVASAGDMITLTIMPDSGYELDSIRASGAGDIAIGGSGSIRTFTMPPENVRVTAAFAPKAPPATEAGDTDDPDDPDDTGEPGDTDDPDEAGGETEAEPAEMGPLNIYRGGAREGITVGELSDDKKYYPDSIDMESDMPGRGSHQQSIKISAAVNGNGNAVQQSFGLFSDTEIDLETVSALSFWAKANKALNIRYVGFGDDDPDKRVVYTGEGFNQSIPITAEWKRYIVPVPAPNNGQKTTRVFMFNAQVALGNYVCLDDIEFIQSGVTLTGIEIASANNTLFYGATGLAKILKGAPLKLTYAYADGTTATLQFASNSHTLKYNLLSWLLPFVQVNGNVAVSQGVIFPLEKSSACTLAVNMAGKTSNPMAVNVIDGIIIDDFEDIESTGSGSIPGTPASGTGYLWHTSCSGSMVVGRDDVTAANNEIHSGLRAGSWRHTATAKNPRGGRNGEAKDAAGYGMLSFWIKVTNNTSTNAVIQRNTVFTFELRNEGLLANKTSGAFFSRQFTYDPANDNATNGSDGWQEIKIPLAEFTDDKTGAKLDSSAITGYAFGVVDNQGSALRIMLDDIALVK